MTNRIIKFRAWEKEEKVMYHMRDEFYYYMSGDARLCANGYMENTVYMQFTGLHDKNGKEIFEGDVLIIDDEIFGGKSPRVEVKFEDGAFQTNWNVNDVRSYCEVIGNIYENPELLTP